MSTVDAASAAASHQLASQSAVLDVDRLRKIEPPHGVIVAMRVRPIGTVAREDGQESIVEMEERVTRVRNPDKPEDPLQQFAFDHSYWSADGFELIEDGTRVPDGPASRYASQERVWADLGTTILGNALNGFDATVLAYGQTGAGKTFSVLGHPPELGVVPRAVHALFHIKEKESTEQAAAAPACPPAPNSRLRGPATLLTSARGTRRCGTRWRSRCSRSTWRRCTTCSCRARSAARSGS